MKSCPEHGGSETLVLKLTTGWERYEITDAGGKRFDGTSKPIIISNDLVESETTDYTDVYLECRLCSWSQQLSPPTEVKWDWE